MRSVLVEFPDKDKFRYAVGTYKAVVEDMDNVLRHVDRYFYGTLHCENGPAVIHINGTKVWYRNGKKHRKNGPAIEYPSIPGSYFYNGAKLWFQNDVLHREDGPAYTTPGGDNDWYLDSVKYSEEDWKKELKRRRNER